MAPAKALGVSRLLTAACAEMIEGQVLDLSYEQRQTVSVADYLLMISKKTGALLESSVHMGSMIGTGDARTIEAMRLFGKELGRVFQVRDDMLGVWGKQETTGKPAASDIHRRKKALPAVHALATAKGPARERLLAVYRKDAPLTEQDVTDVLAVMDELGTSTFCQSLAKEHAALSLQALEGVELSKAARRECAELTQFLLEREY